MRSYRSGTRPGRAVARRSPTPDLGVEQLGAVYERVLDLDPADIVRVSLEGSRAAERPTATARRGARPRPIAESRRGPSTRRSRWPSSSCAARSDRSSAARPPTRSWPCASSIRRWGAAPFSSPRAATSRRRTSARSSKKGAAPRPISTATRAPTSGGCVAEHCLAGVDRQSGRRAARSSVVVADDARARQAAQLPRSSPADRQQPDRHVAGRSLATAGPAARSVRQPCRCSKRRGSRTRCARSRGPSASWPRRVTTTSKRCTQECDLAPAERRAIAARSVAQAPAASGARAGSGRRGERADAAAVAPPSDAELAAAIDAVLRGGSDASAARDVESLDLDRAGPRKPRSGCFTGRSNSPTCSTTSAGSLTPAPGSTP